MHYLTHTMRSRDTWGCMRWNHHNQKLALIYSLSMAKLEMSRPSCNAINCIGHQYPWHDERCIHALCNLFVLNHYLDVMMTSDI